MKSVLGRQTRVGRPAGRAADARLDGVAGVHRRRWRHGQRSEATWNDRVQRQFVADAPDRLWVTDIERHEALSNRVGVGDLHRRAVAAARS